MNSSSSTVQNQTCKSALGVYTGGDNGKYPGCGECHCCMPLTGGETVIVRVITAKRWNLTKIAHLCSRQGRGMLM